MAKNRLKGDLYERTINGETQYRHAPMTLQTSRVARDMWAAQGWEKSAGKSPVGVSAKPATKAKQEKQEEEQFETV